MRVLRFDWRQWGARAGLSSALIARGAAPVAACYAVARESHRTSCIGVPFGLQWVQLEESTTGGSNRAHCDRRTRKFRCLRRRCVGWRGYEQQHASASSSRHGRGTQGRNSLRRHGGLSRGGVRRPDRTPRGHGSIWNQPLGSVRLPPRERYLQREHDKWIRFARHQCVIPTLLAGTQSSRRFRVD